jgi:hypothetical protein
MSATRPAKDGPRAAYERVLREALAYAASGRAISPARRARYVDAADRLGASMGLGYLKALRARLNGWAR